MPSQFLPLSTTFIRSVSRVLGIVVAGWSMAGQAQIAQPFTTTYGGRLTQPDGKAVTGPVSLVIKFFATAAGGTPLDLPGIGQAITRNNVNLDNGVFQVDLADLAAMNPVLGSGQHIFVEITDATNIVTYPRQRITAVPYALRVPVDGTTIFFNNQGRLTANLASASLTGDVTGTLGAASVQKIKGVEVDLSGSGYLKFDSGKLILSTPSGGTGIDPSTIVTAGTVTTAQQEAINIKPYGNMSGNTGELRFSELSTNGPNFVGFKAPSALTSDVVFTLPESTGSSGQMLATNGMGQLVWSNPAAAAVTTVVGRTGNVTLSTTDVSEGIGKYFTDSRARSAISSAAPISYSAVSGALSISQASGGSDGYLSAADFLVLSSKQSAITSSSVVSAGALSTSSQAGLELKPYGSVVGATGELRFTELAANGTNFVAFKAPDNLSTNLVLTLPPTMGASGQVLSTDGAGSLSWVTPGGAAAGTVTSVAGRTGAVALSTTDISEGMSHYFTTSRARAALNTAAPLLYDSLTGTIQMSQASGIQNGFLSSNDWFAFNSKQNMLGYTPLNKAGDTMTGNLNMGATQRVVNLASPIAAGDAANKQYVDSGLALKADVANLGSMAYKSVVASPEIADGTIMDQDIAATANIADTKLATIFTPGKVSGSAIVSGMIGGSTIINTTGNIITNGRVGIGTSTPATTLAVNGSLSVRVMNVNAATTIPFDVAVVIVTAGVTLTLPSCSTGNSGQLLTIVSRSPTNGTIIAPSGTSIYPAGQSTSVSSTPLISLSSVRLVCDGSSSWQSI